MNKTTISQTWHLLNKSSCFITMDSGLLHLAGTTDAEVIMLGSSINPEFRLPYRKNSQTYKQHYVAGKCELNCASDMKYGVKEWGNIQGVPPLIGCLENKSTFECHPRVESVLHKIENIITYIHTQQNQTNNKKNKHKNDNLKNQTIINDNSEDITKNSKNIIIIIMMIIIN